MITIDQYTRRECDCCGKWATIEADERLCADCLQEDELSNAHQDGLHKGRPVSDCHDCKEEHGE